MVGYDYYVYILTNWNDKVMYIGVTNNLERRISEHIQELVEGFTKKYHVHKLVYYEHFEDVKIAIAREKELKGWTRQKKNDLVSAVNPEWKEIDLTY
ncbi:MAG: GIY-YIG nuclease family protein [Clostridia bacterium]|nr:GIY-YIG nuclease family protein [Clostridia bacterium]